MRITHTSRRMLRLVPFLAFTLLASGCRWFFPPRPVATASQSAVVDALKNYDIGEERLPTVENDPAFQGPTAANAAAPTTITIATMTLKPSGARGSRRFLARITSNKDYPLLGIYEGQNFVWRNTWDSTVVSAPTWINTITPAALGKDDHVLTRDPRPSRYPVYGGAHEPSMYKLIVRSIALVVCLDDPMCSTGHCGYY